MELFSPLTLDPGGAAVLDIFGPKHKFVSIQNKSI